MSFFQPRVAQVCKCSAYKNAHWKYTFDENFSRVQQHSDKRKPPKFNKPRKVDILILLEKKELDLVDTFALFVEKYFVGLTYEIILSVNCISKKSVTSDTLQPFLDCKKHHVKSTIEKYNPEVVITSGNAIYTFTENKKLKPHHFYSLHEDDVSFYSPEFGVEVFPIPALFQFINGNQTKDKNKRYTLKDLYETNFTLQQIERAKRKLSQNGFRKRPLVYEEIEDPNPFLEDLIKKDITDLAIDTETTGLFFYKDKIHSISLSWDGQTGYFFLWEKVDRRLMIKLFERQDICFVFQNASFDLKMFKSHGIHNARCDFDTLLAAHAVNENSPNGLKSLTWIYTKYGGYDNELKKYIKGEHITDFSLIPKKILIKYACYDAIITLQLKEYLTIRLDQEDEDVRNNFYHIVMPALPMLIDVEMNGIGFDDEYAKEYAFSLADKAKKVEKLVHETVGYSFNVGSNKQVTEALKKMSIPPLRDSKGKPLLTKNNDYILNKETLPKYAKKYDIAKHLLDYNHLTKEISQIGVDVSSNDKGILSLHTLFTPENEEEEEKGMMEFVYNGRLYGNYNLHGTVTSRLSSSSPNLQNFPKVEIFRRLFIPRKGCVILEADFSGMETRIYSQISGSGELEKALLNGVDLHCLTGCSVMNLLNGTNVTYEEFFQKTKIEGQEDAGYKKFRQFGKVVNFQMLYGVTEFGLSEALNVPVEEAKKIMEAYYLAYPEVKEYMDRNFKFAKKHGYVKSLLGWKRNLPVMTYVGKDSIHEKNYKTGKNSTMNSPVQSTSGQTTLISMTKVWQEIKERGLKSIVMGNVHDSILMEVTMDEIEIMQDILTRHMKKPYYENPNIKGRGACSVYNDIDIEIGSTWGFGKSIAYWNQNQNEWESEINRIDERNLINKN